MTDENAGSSLESIVAQIADEFMAQRKRGARPDPSAYARRYPEFADVIRQVLSSLDLADLSSWSEVGRSDDVTETLPRHLGDFRIVREIGRGGMGIVYEAVQLSLNRRVALKVLPFAAALDPRHLQRFRNEAQSAAQLHHSNIVPVFAVGCERGVHFYAMQFIDGQTLAQVIKDIRAAPGANPAEDPDPSSEPISLDVVQAPPAPPVVAETAALAGLSTERSDGRSEFFRTTAKIGMRVAEALDYAHRQGVIHRDIKPANILVDAQGDVWITDFGLARLKNENGLTVSGDFLGTLRYMSPEQTTGSRTPVDHRSDIYSLGATLYELLALRPVFASQERAVLLRQITSEEPCPLRRLDRAVPVELEIILSKALAKEPGARYETAQELADDLRRFLDHKPIRARRPSLWERSRKWAHRHRPAVWSALIAFMVSLIVVGGSIGWVLRDRAIQQDRAAAEERADHALAASLDSIRLANAESDDRFRILPIRLPDYLQAFSDHGWAPGVLTPREAADRLARRPRAVRDTIIGALDHVVILARFTKAPEANWLQGILDWADNDPWRQALRAARQRQDRPAIIRLAAQVDVKSQPRETLFVLELGLFQRGAYDAALDLLRRAQQAFPDDFWINYDLGDTLRWYRPAERHEAIRFLTVATALRPKHLRARVLLGNALVANDQLDEAMQAFRRAIELDPTYARAHYELGLALAEKGRLGDCISSYEQALSLTPDDGHRYPNRAVIYCDFGNVLLRMGHIDEAIITVHKAIVQKPDFARPRWIYAFALLRSGRFSDAALALCQAVSAEIRARTAEVRARTKRPTAKRKRISVE